MTTSLMPMIFLLDTNNDRRNNVPEGEWVPQFLPNHKEAVAYAKRPNHSGRYNDNAERHNENQRGMYTSCIFGAGEASTSRTVHMGMDIGAPVDTPVYAFEAGIVHLELCI